VNCLTRVRADVLYADAIPMPRGMIDVDPADGVLVVQVRSFGTIPAEVPSVPAPLRAEPAALV